ncbi:hypothetical protein [Kocuria dechangensis]|nr:hypothetical protein [Kocuria dechangensis]
MPTRRQSLAVGAGVLGSSLLAAPAVSATPLNSVVRTATAQEDAAQAAANYRQWRIGANKAGVVKSKNSFAAHPEFNYSLKNMKTIKFLQYEKQSWGINLGWTDDATDKTEKKVSRWFFTRRGEEGSSILYGEDIALGNGGGKSFLYYSERLLGINLDWSGTQKFEWQILGGKKGTVVKRDAPVAIFNTKANLFFIYFDRNRGGDIGWNDSTRWGTQLKKMAEKKAIELIKKELGA